MSSVSNSSLPTVILGLNTNAPFPCIDNILNFYYKKNIKTIFASIGTSKSCIADLEMSETLGCPIFIAPGVESKKWKTLERYIKEKNLNTYLVCDTSDSFFTGFEEKWVLPRNIRIQETVPWWTSGSIDVGTESLKTTIFTEWVSSICSTMDIDEIRLDILKVDLPNGLERGILLSMLDAGFRPALVLVNWLHSPDADVSTTLSAGHLQNCGYTLLRIEGTKCLYYYLAQDAYMMNSWENTNVPNPMIAEFFKVFKNSQKQTEGGNAKNFLKSVSSDRETITSSFSKET
jgi:hypothetical protein